MKVQNCPDALGVSGDADAIDPKRGGSTFASGFQLLA